MIILMGQPGTGKSTQGKLISKSRNWSWISTGDIIRKHLNPERLISINKGDLLNDQETIKILSEVLSKQPKDQEFILDGFPRTKIQTEWLIENIKSGLLKMTAVLYLKISKEEAAKRLLGRGRKDDTKETIEYRYVKYTTDTLPILDFFERNGIKINNVNADQIPEQVASDINKILNKT